jgi:hypothetical protein
MSEKKTIAFGIICLLLATILIATVTVLNKTDQEIRIKSDQISEMETEKNIMETQILNLQTEINSLTNEASTLKDQLSILQKDTYNLENEKSTLKNENALLEEQVVSLQSEKLSLETQASNLQNEITESNNNAITLEAQVSILQTEVNDLEDEVIQNYNLGYTEGESNGYDKGYDEGFIKGIEYLTETGYYLRDPTYAEAIEFINFDKTDQNDYTHDYVCYDFTADFSANAVQAGYRCGFVYLIFVDSAHSIACFNTIDQGLIYIEPQNDEVVTVAIGQQYSGYVITDLGIIW